jgi:hypothetical protein
LSDNPPEPTGIKIGDLKKLIQDTVADVVKGITPDAGGKPDDTPASTDNSSVADKVRAEIEKIRGREAEEKEKETIKTQLAELKSKTEQAPVERSRLHKFMGWGENASR